MDNDKYIFKTITIGDANVGKTFLCNRICNKKEDLNYMPTIGIEFNSTEIKFNDTNIKLQLWDTAGQECFAPIVRNYYKNIVGIFFVIDLTSDESIKNIDFWLNEYETYRAQDCESIIIAFGNKTDKNNRVISYEEISQIFKNKNIDYFEVSAKKNENIKESVKFFLNKVMNTFDIDNHKGIYLRNLNNELFIKKRESCSYLCEDNPSCCLIN
jgi:small GTP-binding protein